MTPARRLLASTLLLACTPHEHPREPQAPCPVGMALVEGGPGGPASLCVDLTEVTTAAYGACVHAGVCSPAVLDPAGACNLTHADRGAHPINCVTFRQASAYCAAAGGRLPTEDEWELAARGSDGRRFPWGDAPPGPTRLNACGLECKGWYADAQLSGAFDGVMYDGDDGFAGTAPVASFPAGATPDGIFDLLGNVAEWTATAVDFGAAAPAPRAPHAYVVRGGSFSSGVDADSAPALRLYLDAEAHGRGVGFRCAFAPQSL